MIITVTWAKKKKKKEFIYAQIHLEAAAQSPPRVVQRLNTRDTDLCRA